MTAGAHASFLLFLLLIQRVTLLSAPPVLGMVRLAYQLH
jgi:hypothetical protein